MSLRTRLALVFIAATLVPLEPTVWLTVNLFERSLALRISSLRSRVLSIQREVGISARHPNG